MSAYVSECAGACVRACVRACMRVSGTQIVRRQSRSFSITFVLIYMYTYNHQFCIMCVHGQEKYNSDF